ncbi:MAG: gliding motility-associated C-terminal domain-containing protein [Saprospiraceae bacterium]|nr:gliding motility-associated C-terminal domain-containing protein [Candidatus Brachybacter algidus]MBL0120801.1 gliding motility-associated C-terminal domain-containing protein [Candidatus Brachybacter algidus]
MANSVDINVTNIITPNNDGFNDVLRFNSQQIIKESELWIYNRWGAGFIILKIIKTTGVEKDSRRKLLLCIKDQ